MNQPHLTRRVLGVATAAMVLTAAGAAYAAKAGTIVRDSRAGLQQLYAANSKAKAIGAEAKAVLVFPKIVKAGAMVGAQTGEGALLAGSNVKGFYRISAASFGMQLGAQKFGYAVFLMSDKAIANLSADGGFAIGSSPSVVVVDEFFARTMNTKTLSKDVYAVAFGNKGLMAGSGLEGSKITQIYPDP